MTSRRPHLTCCAEGARFIALRYDPVQLHYTEHADRDAFLRTAQINPPRWKIQAVNQRVGGVQDVSVSICPFCGTQVPSIRLRSKPPKRVCVVTDGGYYCDQCERRLIECRCAPTERLWEAISRKSA